MLFTPKVSVAPCAASEMKLFDVYSRHRVAPPSERGRTWNIDTEWASAGRPRRSDDTSIAIDRHRSPATVEMLGHPEAMVLLAAVDAPEQLSR